MNVGLYAQGTDNTIFLSGFVGFTLQAGDTVRGQFRYILTDALPIAEVGVNGVTGLVDASAQTVLITIPETASALWKPPDVNFTLYTTLLIVGSGGAHRLAVELGMDWRASYTRGVSA